MEENLFPSKRSVDAGKLDEERRLCYVGMTRGKEELILTCSGEESRFLAHLSGNALFREKEKPRKKEESCHQMSLFELED